MRVTVAICTWNRCELLRQALEQMKRLRIATGTEWELVVVNNRCTDATDEVIASCEGALPVRRVYEPEIGLSHARNAAVRAATGQYILWTDDDTLVDPEWLAAYVEAFHRWPDAVAFGGPVRPWFLAPPPPWIESGWSHIADAFATRDLGPHPHRFGGGTDLPYGANYAVRLAEQRRYLYDPQLGQRGGTLNLGEETKLVKDLLAAGFDAWWVPPAVVRHCIPAARMTTGYLRRYYFASGWLSAHNATGDDGPAIFGRPRWVWKRAVVCGAKYLFGRWLSPPEVWLENLVGASKAWGYLWH